MKIRSIEQDLSNSPKKQFLNTLLYDLSTSIGRTVNLLTVLVIIISVLVSMFGTVDSVPVEIRERIRIFEVAITVIFTLEYMLRAYVGRWPLAYILSFYGIVDLLTWLPLLLFGDTYLALRLLRILRLLKLVRYLRAMRVLFASMLDIFDTIFLVLGTICIIVLVSGNLIYFLEPATFENAFIGCWWSLVTMSTVGYGDLVPHTMTGKIEAAVLMLLGITMFALLTAAISVKMSEYIKARKNCMNCKNAIQLDAAYCPFCGEKQ